MPINVIFWNIQRKPNSFINDLASVAKDVDILLLAESNIDDSEIEKTLNIKRVKPTLGKLDEGKFTPKLYSRLGKSLQHFTTHLDKRLIFLPYKP